MKNNDKRLLMKSAIVLAIGLASVQTYMRHVVDKKIPSVPSERVEEGYVCPSDLEVFSEDFFGDGKRELVLKIKGKHYHLKYERGRPPSYEEGKPFLEENYNLCDRKILR